MRAAGTRCMVLLLGLVLHAGGPAAAAQASDASSPARRASAAAAQAYFTDVELVNQDGEPMRFYTDLLKDKLVVIDTIYTTCAGICPVMSKTFARLQEHLGDRLGRDAYLLSISVDPENDTPQRLKDFAANFGARPGWYFLTGTRENVHFVLGKLGQDVEDKEDHNAVMLVGNEPAGLWKKAFGLAPAADVVSILDSVMKDEMQPAASAPAGQ